MGVVKTSAVFPIFRRPKKSGTLVVPTFWRPNMIWLVKSGESVACGFKPVPWRKPRCEAGSLSVTVRKAPVWPAVAGVNVMLIVQVALGASVVVQVLFEIAKAVPEKLDSITTMLLSVCVGLVLVRVNDCAMDVVLITWFPKVRNPGVNVATVGTPTPDTATKIGLPVKLPLNCKFAVRLLVAVGVKVTLTVQLVPVAMLPPLKQGVPKAPEKSKGSVPVFLRETVTGTFPGFDKVTVCGALGTLIS